MSWITFHARSEELANQAEAALKKGNKDRANELYRTAAAEEMQALATLDPKKSRTLGITAISAAALWFKAGDLKQAEYVAYQWLATEYLPDFAIPQLQTILQIARSERYIKEIISLLASQPAPEQILGINPPSAVQARVSDLLSRSKDGTLTNQEEVELERYLALEHQVRLAKARAYEQLSIAK